MQRVTVKEVKRWLKSLEEFRYRKVRNVDARRVTSFINNGLSEMDLPMSLLYISYVTFDILQYY